MTEHPYLTPESEPYWEGLKNGKLLLQRCGSCGAFRHYPRPVCPHCFSMEHGWSEASGKGRLHSWTISHHAFRKDWVEELPYTLAIVDLPEGVRMQARLRDVPPESLRIGLPVRLRLRIVDEEVALPEFGPEEQPAPD